MSEILKQTRKVCAVLLGILFALSWSIPVYAADYGASGMARPASLEDTLPPAEGETSPDLPPDTDNSNSSETLPAEDTEQPEQTPDASTDDSSAPLEPGQDNQEEQIPPEPDVAPEQNGVIDVIVPPQGHMTINPYRMKVEADDGTATREQIFNPVQTLVNCGSQSVSVNVRAIGRVPEGSGAVLVSEPPFPDSTEKEVFLYAEFQSEPDAWLEEYVGAVNQVLAAEEGAESWDVLTLAPESEGYFRIFGAMAEAPDSLWEKNDTFDVSLAFSFTALGGGEDQAGEKTEPAPAGPTKPETPENPDSPGDPNATPETPESPADPDGPTDPEPAEPKPTEPVDPTEPPDGTEIPEEPEPPTETVEPSEPSKPAIPETPGDTGEPEEQEPSDPSQAPEEPGTAGDPETPEEPAPPSAADEPGESEEAAEPEPPAEPDSQTEPEA